MKFVLVLLLTVEIESLPVRGAWIEMIRWRSCAGRKSSLPVRGAWIEITTARVGASRTRVAPRAGSVD